MKRAKSIRNYCCKNGASVRAIVLVLFITWSDGASALADTMSINFDSLFGMNNQPRALVPANNRLSDQLQSTTGATFSSLVPYVAVVAMPAGYTESLPNLIGGVKPDGTLSYAAPVTIVFSDPTNPALAAVTSFVQIRGDTVPAPNGTATMQAFDVVGDLLGTVTAADSSQGLTLAISNPNIHSVQLTQDSQYAGNDGTIGFDNLQFESVTAVPEPPAEMLSLQGTVMCGLLLVRRSLNRTKRDLDLIVTF